MKQFITIFMLLLGLAVGAQDNAKVWCGNVNAEFSAGIAGHAKEHSYCSAGIAASYGVLLNDKYYIGLGVKPNYIFSDGGYEGFFLPIYAEFQYRFFENGNFGIFGLARAGYSPVDYRGAYVHLGCGVNYKRWQFGIGTTYQYGTFEEIWFDKVMHFNENLVFQTISVGYRF